LVNQILILAHGGWEVCDGAHRRFVMKKSHPMTELFELDALDTDPRTYRDALRSD
jgi:hypothetical protein